MSEERSTIMHFKRILILGAMLFILTYQSIAFSQALDERLEVLQPMLNKKWVGMLKAPDGSKEFKIIREYKSVWEGSVIKCKKTNYDLNNFGEGYFYWDDIVKKIAYFFIENGGVFLKGYVTIEKNVITIEGMMTWPQQHNPSVKQSFDFKNTFELIEDGKMIDRWFQNAFGPWRPGHVIEFKLTNKESEKD